MTDPDLRSLIRDIPDFPSAGIMFKDITPLLLDHEAVRFAVRELADWARPRQVDYVVAAEARGFILGAALALELDQEGAADDRPAEALDQLGQRPRRPAGGEQVVVDQHPRAVRERVRMHLERVDAVLEDVLGRDRVGR